MDNDNDEYNEDYTSYSEPGNEINDWPKPNA